MAAYNDFGDIFLLQENYNDALLNYDSALSYSLPMNEKPWFEFPEDSTQDLSIEQLSTIAKKISLFQNLDTDSIPRSDLLKYGLSYASNTHDFLIDRRQEFSASEGKLFLSEEFRSVYETAVSIAYNLYTESGDEAYILEGLKFFRLSKSILYLEQSAEYEKVNNNIIDQDLKRQFSTFKKSLDVLESGFYSLLDNSATSDSIVTINDSLGVVRSKLNAVLDTIDNELEAANWPAIDQLLAQDLKEIENRRGVAQIEYFFGEEYLYIIAFGNNKLSFNRIALDEKLNNDLINVLGNISSPPNLNTFKQDMERFSSSSFSLFEKLLEDELTTLGEVESIIIIPDQILSRLPFEVLITDYTANMGYDNMPFLMEQYTIRYQLSSLASSQPERSKVGSEILGLGYSSTQSRGGFDQLPGTEKEINFLKASYKGTFINSASKEQFLDLASNYDVLHLAVHGLSDTLNKYESKLIFSAGNEPELKTSDLYLAGLNARLAILSACESGVGAMNKGEGSFSIARGFAISGVPSLVMSLWNVPDNITSGLMEVYVCLFCR